MLLVHEISVVFFVGKLFQTYDIATLSTIRWLKWKNNIKRLELKLELFNDDTLIDTSVFLF